MSATALTLAAVLALAADPRCGAAPAGSEFQSRLAAIAIHESGGDPLVIGVNAAGPCRGWHYGSHLVGPAAPVSGKRLAVLRVRAMDEVRQARAKVRERERAIWNRVETVGREARAADGAAVKASAAATAGTEPNREKQAQTLSSGS